MSRCRFPTLRAAFAVLVSLALALSACRGTRGQGPTNRASAGPAVAHSAAVGSVDGVPVYAEEIEAIARTEHLPDARTAFEHLVADRLLAAEARRRGHVEMAEARVSESASVQLLLERTIERQERAATIPADEWAAASAVRGFDLAHGPLIRVRHAVFRVAESDPADKVSRALAEATAFATEARAFAPFHVDDGFSAAALRHKTNGLDVVAEELPPFDANGAAGRAAFDGTFARNAFQLQTPSEISAPFRTPFGFHVVQLLQQLPALERDPAEVRAVLQAEVVARRRQRALDAMIQDLRRRYAVTPSDHALRAVEAANVGVGGS